MEQIAHPILTDLSPERLAAAVEKSMIAWIPLFALLGGEYREDAPPGVKRSITPLMSSLWNSIAGARLEPEQAEPAIQTIMADARARGIPIAWWVGPLSQPADLGQRLEAHGFTKAGTPGMAVDLECLNEDLPVPPGLTIECVQDEAGWRTWNDACSWVWSGKRSTDFENNPWYRMAKSAPAGLIYAYYGSLEGQLAAVSLLFLGAGVAGIYVVGTHPDARQKGIGARMTLEPLLLARRLGYRAGVLGASQMGFSVYRRIGFEEVCRIDCYEWRP